MTSKGDPSEESLCFVALADALEAVFVEALGADDEAPELDVVRAAAEAPVMLDTTGPVEVVVGNVFGPVYVARTLCSASSALSTASSDSGWPSVLQAVCQVFRGEMKTLGSLSASQPCLTQEVSAVKVEPVA